MEQRIEVLGVRLDCLSAKELMRRVMEFMETDTVDTVGMMTMDALMNGREDAAWRSCTDGLCLAVPGEAEILEAADVRDRLRLKETKNRVFLKMFLKYLQKNRRKIYLLAGTEEELLQAERAVRRYDREMLLTGSAVLENGDREEEVVNDINGTETDCVFSVLPSPYQEDFISRNRTLLSIRLWFGCAPALISPADDIRTVQHLRRFFRKKMFRHQVEREQKEK
ncbi:MAG TPA: WecB/TagA/CpsF family glycosyltransferase [Candidatus Mediterraneibacter merdipullorum]|nr:WecB/TagA/CpsF family glycosyltransferase [Candidatus Mediterraneibacter merdipullorum]